MRPHRVIHHYEVLERIGAGGMGDVFMAWDTKLHRMVALKVLTGSVTADVIRKERFLREARAASALDHPAICTIYEINETPDGSMYLAMACYDGETVADRLKRGPFPATEAVRITARIAAGLARAHAVGVTHRDIKPANIMLTADDQPKILDFGIAKIAGDDLTGDSDSIFGTAAYMAPERIKGDAVDDRADIWSLGVMFHEMLTGSRPFAGDIPAVLHAILNNPPKPLPEDDSDTGVSIRRVLQHALEKNPNDRYSSMASLEADLLNILNESAPTARPLPRPRQALPAELTSFVGRERETEAVCRLVRESRLVTLTGTPGTGKTRLAMRVAEECDGVFEDGAAFIPLASVVEAGLVASRIATTLSLPEAADRTPEASLCDGLKHSRRLIVLDNFEQVVDAADVVVKMLANCPAVHILITSRVALRVTGEQEYPVPPLALPDAGEPADILSLEIYPATALFVQRARAVRPDWTPGRTDAEAIRTICRRLDGLPLAIELAAARIRLFPPDALLKRLENRLDLLTGGPRDRPARQQTLREAIAWSYNLLRPEEQMFFRRIGVFAGGLTPEAAEVVAAGSGLDPLEGIEALLNHSLLANGSSRGGSPRFVLLETIREFALEQLRAAGEEEDIRRKHAGFYLDFVRKAAPELTGPDQSRWLIELDEDHDNIQAAFDWAESRGDSEYGLELASAVWRFWAVRGFLRQGRLRLERFLALPGAGGDTIARARALNALGTMSHMLGGFEDAAASFEESLAIFRGRGDDGELAVILNNLGWIYVILARTDRARAMNEEALALCQGKGFKRGMALACNNLGWHAALRGEHRDALTLQERNLGLRKEIGDERGIAYALASRAWSQRALGRLEDAETSARESLRLLNRIDERQILGFCLTVIGTIAAHRGDHDEAENWFNRAEAVWLKSGNMWGWTMLVTEATRLALQRGDISRAAERLAAFKENTVTLVVPWTTAEMIHLEGCVAAANGDAGTARALYEKSLRMALDVESASVLEDTIEDGAALRESAGDAAGALRLLAFVGTSRERSGRCAPRVRLERFEAIQARLRERLGLEATAAAEIAGRELTADQAVAIVGTA